MATSLSFNEQFYLSTYPDVAAAVSRGQFASAQAHYNEFGRFEGRDPNAYFSTSFYLSQYPDVANARANPLEHFLLYGAAEGRFANANADGAIDTNNNNRADDFNEAAYLAANTDVAAAVGPGKGFVSGFQHYELFGQFEGRTGATLINGTVLTGPFATAGQGGGTNPGQIITLTNNVDGPNAIAPAVNTNGTINNDTYLSGFGSAQGDFIDGKGGTDTLKLTGSGNATVVLNNVERVEAAAIGGGGLVNIAGSTGVQTLAAVGGSNNIEFTGVGSKAALDITNQSAGSVVVNYVPSVVAGAADAQSINISNYGLTTTAAGSIVLDGIETVNITAAGTNNFNGLFNPGATGSTLQTVTVAGTGSVAIANSLASSVTSFDGSTASGAIDVSFVAGGDVAVKTGSGNDRVAFDGATGFTTKDTVDLGAGAADTIAIVGSDVRAASNEQLKALNAVKGAEILEFTGVGSASLNNSTLTNTELNKFVFQTGGTDTIENAGTKVYAFGTDNGGDATFTLAGSNTTLNVNLEGASKTVTQAFDDANVGNLNTGGALTVNLNSTGTTDAVLNFATLTNADFNDVGTLTAAANATVNLTGNANTAITSFANAVNLQAGTLTGALIATGSGGDDILVGGTSKNLLAGAGGVDNIDITKSASVAGDIVSLTGIISSTDRDTVSGFQAGANGDIIRFAAADTTAPTAAGATIAIQEISSNTGTVNFLTGANDVLELNFNLAGTTLAASNGANALNGTNLLAAVGTLNVAATTDTGYIVAYQGGNAYVYHVTEGVDAGAAVAAADIQLVGTFNGVAVGALDTSNFQLV